MTERKVIRLATQARQQYILVTASHRWQNCEWCDALFLYGLLYR